MIETIWSVIAVLGGFAVVGLILWALATNRDEREEEEAARRYFDEHGRWPDETPSA
jgi:hypothetical protein